jgi:hypothetical protein
MNWTGWGSTRGGPFHGLIIVLPERQSRLKAIIFGCIWPHCWAGWGQIRNSLSIISQRFAVIDVCTAKWSKTPIFWDKTLGRWWIFPEVSKECVTETSENTQSTMPRHAPWDWNQQSFFFCYINLMLLYVSFIRDFGIYFQIILVKCYFVNLNWLFEISFTK